MKDVKDAVQKGLDGKGLADKVWRDYLKDIKMGWTGDDGCVLAVYSQCFMHAVEINVQTKAGR